MTPIYNHVYSGSSSKGPHIAECLWLFNYFIKLTNIACPVHDSCRNHNIAHHWKWSWLTIASG